MADLKVPSKNEWGRKRVDFYVNAASRTREDGILNEEEQEVLELEEEDALERQHKLDSVNTALDYKKMGNIFEDSSSDDEEEEKSEKQVKPLKTQPTRRVHFSKNLVEKQALPSSSKNDQQQINGVQNGKGTASIKRPMPSQNQRKRKANFVEGWDEEPTAFDHEDDERRHITYEMQKNKGLLHKRKKEAKHSRVKRRAQYKKALIKRRSQIPDVKREMNKYTGEARGIRMSTVRSVPLKG